MDHFRPQKQFPKSKLGIQVGLFRSLSSQNVNQSSTDIHTIRNSSRPTIPTNLELYSTHNEHLPTDSVQKLISNHHFNQQVTLSFPMPSEIYNNNTIDHEIITKMNDQIYTALQNTYIYQLQCDLSLLFTEPFGSKYFPQLLSTKQPITELKSTSNTNTTPHLISKVPQPTIYATSTHTTLNHNSFSIVNNHIFFNLNKDTYQSLGFTAPYILKNNTYQFKIPIDRPNLPRLRELLSNKHINTLSMMIFAQQGNVSIPIDFGLLDLAYASQQSLYFNEIHNLYATIPYPIRTQPVLSTQLIQSETSNFTSLSQSPLSTNSTTITTNDTMGDASNIVTGPQVDDTSNKISTFMTSAKILWKRLNYRYLSTPPHTNGDTPFNTQYTIIPAIHDACNSTQSLTPPLSSTTPSRLSTKRYLHNSAEENADKLPKPNLIWISSYFRYIPVDVLHKFIISFFSTKVEKTTLEDECNDNLLHENKKEFKKQSKNQNDKTVQLFPKANAKVNAKANAKANATMKSSDSDESDDDDDDIIDPKFISYYVQKVRQSTKSPPKAPKYHFYQQLAHQLLLYIGLLYTNNDKLYSHYKRFNQKSLGPKYEIDHDPFSLLQFDTPAVTVKESYQSLHISSNSNSHSQSSKAQGFDQNTPTINCAETSTSLTTGQTFNITIRGILPPCVLVHICKQLRYILSTQLSYFSTPSTVSSIPRLLAVPHICMSVYGIPSAVVQYDSKFHSNSMFFGGNGESNYTIILTSMPDMFKNDTDLPQTSNSSSIIDKGDSQMPRSTPIKLGQDAYIILRTVDHGSQEL